MTGAFDFELSVLIWQVTLRAHCLSQGDVMRPFGLCAYHAQSPRATDARGELERSEKSLKHLFAVARLSLLIRISNCADTRLCHPASISR